MIDAADQFFAPAIDAADLFDCENELNTTRRSKLHSFIAPADAPAVAAADRFTAVIAVVAVVADAELNYDKLIGLLMLLIDAADPFFLAIDSNTKRIGVPPL